MIPLLAVLRLGGTSQHRGPAIPVPLFLVWLILFPLVLLISPLFVIGCLIARLNPVRVAWSSWRFVSATRGTHVEVVHGRANFLIHVV